MELSKKHVLPQFTPFIQLMKTKYKTECYIAIKINTYKQFETKWGFLVNLSSY